MAGEVTTGALRGSVPTALGEYAMIPLFGHAVGLCWL